MRRRRLQVTSGAADDSSRGAGTWARRGHAVPPVPCRSSRHVTRFGVQRGPCGWAEPQPRSLGRRDVSAARGTPTAPALGLEEPGALTAPGHCLGAERAANPAPSPALSVVTAGGKR